MNFLAHSLLARDDPAEMAGQFAADFVRGRRAPDGMTAAIWQGVLAHRAIDAFTDRHPEVAAARARFEPPLRRLAGIVLDVSFDHMLARDWSRYACRSLPAHIEHVHTMLANEQESLPPRAARFVAWLRRDRVLADIDTLDGVERALVRLSRRGPAFAPLGGARAVVEADFQALQAHFERFFPAISTHMAHRPLDAFRQIDAA